MGRLVVLFGAVLFGAVLFGAVLLGGRLGGGFELGREGPSAKDTTASPAEASTEASTGAPQGAPAGPGPVAARPFLRSFPDAGTTGVQPGVALVAGPESGVWELDHSIEHVVHHGAIVVRAADVSIRNVRVELDGEGIAIANPDGHPGLRIEHVDVVCRGERRGQAGIAGSHLVVLAVDVSGCVDGLKVGTASTVAASYIHDLGFGTASHNDGIQIGDGADITVIGNTIVQPDNGLRQANAAVFVQDTYDAVARVRIVGNYVDGFGFTLRLSGGRITASEVSANVIGDAHLFGPYLLDRGAQDPGRANVVVGNVRPDGAPIP